MKMLVLWRAALLAGFLGAGAAASAQVVAPLRPFDPAVARVAGRAEILLAPDQARVSVSFLGSGDTAIAASNSVAGRVRALEGALRGVSATQVLLERNDISVRPVLREGGDRRPDRINGYEASAQVIILVRDLALLSRAVETSVAASPDAFNDIAFSIRDTAAARRQAREAAIRDAVDKARTYVEGAGFRLGRLLLVEEGGGGMIAQSGNVMNFRASAAPREEAAVPPPIAPEPQLYTAEVQVVFEIGPAAPAGGR